MKHCPNPDCPASSTRAGAAEYRDEIADCADCGTALASGPPPSFAEPDERPGDELVAVGRFASGHEAHVVRSSLMNAGIPAVVGQDHGQFVSAAPWVVVMVPKSYANLADRILQSMPTPVATDAEDEDVEDTATVERELRLKRIGRASRWVAFLAILFFAAGTVQGFAILTLVRKVRAELASLPDYAPAPESLMRDGYAWMVVDVDTGQPMTVGGIRDNLVVYTIWGFLENYIIAVTFTALYLWGRRRPLPALIVALCVYLMLLVTYGILDPSTLLKGWLLRVLIIGALVTGIRQALRDTAWHERLESAPAPDR